MNFGLPFNGLKIMDMNVRSLGNKVEAIRILLLSRSLDILALTETWLDETWNDKELAVVGYNLFRRDREANNQSRSCVGGGIVIYARDSLMGKRRYDLESNEMEQMCIEVKQHRYASFFVSSLYRPPNTNAAFFKHLTQLVELISAEAKEIHFVGDFNIDLLQRNDPNSRRLKHLMENFGLHQMIDKPTRITDQSKTLLDHHYSSHQEHVLFTSVPSFGVSDRNPTTLVRKQNAH